MAFDAEPAERDVASGLCDKPSMGRWIDRGLGIDRGLERLAVGFALAGGAVLLAMIGVTLASVLGRVMASTPVPGDFELVEIGCAVAVFAFLPYCQLKRGHAAVDLVTRGASPGVRAGLDGAGGLLMAAAGLLLAWRLTLGGADFQANGEESMILGLPLWSAFVPIVLSVVLWAAVSLRGAWLDFGAARDPHREVP